MHHRTTLAALLAALALLAACDGDDPKQPQEPGPLDTPADTRDLPDAPDMPDDAPDEPSDLAPDLPAAGCPALDGATGPGTSRSGRLDAAQTWAAADSPHRISSSFIVAEDVTLTIEPCAVVLLDDRVVLEVRGTLDAAGTAARPILFGSVDPTKPFAALQRTGAGLIRLAHARLTGGGAATPNTFGMIDLRGEVTGPLSEALVVDTVTLDGSDTFGVSLRGDATVSGQGLTITNAAAGPWRATARLVGGIPAGDYASDPAATIVVDPANPLTHDARWLNHGLPYHISGPSALRVGDSMNDAPPVTLTLDPGATLRFDAAGSILLNARRTTASPSVDVSNGSLIATGTAALPITFEGTTPTPGSWRGVVFAASPTPTSRLEHVIIAHAGGPSQANSYHCSPAGMGAYSPDEDAALTVFGQPLPSLISSSTLRGSAADGINLAYFGDLIDLMPSNTFEDIARCKQTRPRDAEGRCPQDGYCP